MPSGEDIFSILGISLREDPYTRLLKAALDLSEDVRRGVFSDLSGVGGDRIGDVEAPRFRQEFPDNPEQPHSGKKNKPDLLLEGKVDGRQFWVVLEAKVASNEGEQQLPSYHRRCEEAVRQRAILGYRLYFLTLMPKQPSDRAFVNITHHQLAALIDRHLTGGALEGVGHFSFVWQAFKQRLEHLEAAPHPAGSELVLDYLRQEADGFVTENTRCLWLAQFIRESLARGSDRAWYCEGFRMRDFSKLKFWREDWSTRAMFDGDGSNRLCDCFNIHIELDIPPPVRSEKTKVCLHFETNPYLVGARLKKLRDKLVQDVDLFCRMREVFRRVVHAGITDESCRWRATAPHKWKESAVQIARSEVRLTPDTTADELRGDVVDLAESVVVRVEEAIGRIIPAFGSDRP